MSLTERSGTRDLTISGWHRQAFGASCSAFDLDLVGVCPRCDNPLYVWEITRAEWKTTTWTGRTALRLNVPGFLIQYGTDPTGEGVAWIKAAQIYPVKLRIGGEGELIRHHERLRRAHAVLIHGDVVVTP